jgi:hypothetical protein
MNFLTQLTSWFSMLKTFKSLRNRTTSLVHINGIWSPQNYGFLKAARELKINSPLSPHMLEPCFVITLGRKKIALFLYQKKAIQSVAYSCYGSEADSIKALGFY